MSDQEQRTKPDGGASVSTVGLGGCAADTLDDDHPMWLLNEQIKGLLEGDGATEDHDSVLSFLRATGLPEGTVTRVHHAIVFGDTKVLKTPNVKVTGVPPTDATKGE